MTTREIDALTPGRELDAMISREVFGQCPHLAEATEYIWRKLKKGIEALCPHCRIQLPDYRGDFDDGTVKYIDSNDWSCPDYSTDLNAAMLIVDKIGNDLLFNIGIVAGQVDAAFCTVGFPTSSFWHSVSIDGNCAQATATAICKAALKFLRGTKKG